MAQGRRLLQLHHLEELVDLLLVLDDGEGGAGMVEHIGHLVGGGVGIDRHRHRAAHLARDHRPVELRAVLADDRHPLPRLEPEAHQPHGQRPGLLAQLRPGPGLPDAVHLLARGRAAAADAGVVVEELRKRVERAVRRGRSAHRRCPPFDPPRGATGQTSQMRVPVMPSTGLRPGLPIRSRSAVGSPAGVVRTLSILLRRRRAGRQTRRGRESARGGDPRRFSALRRAGKFLARGNGCGARRGRPRPRHLVPNIRSPASPRPGTM